MTARRAPHGPAGTGTAADRSTGPDLRQRTAAAVADGKLQGNVARAVDRFASHRERALDELDDADRLRQAARSSRDRVLADLPRVLERFADAVLARGGNIAWASTAVEARAYIADLARSRGAGRVAKTKSMATEEIALDVALEAVGAEVVETDLGEWIVQLAGEKPSHIIAPALHRDRDQIRDLFVRAEGQGRLGFDGAEPRVPEAGPGAAAARDADEGAEVLGNEPAELMRFARQHMRDVFLSAEIGITGANLAVAESGSIVLVTNEGNGRLVSALPPVHVVVLGMERLVADWQQADLLLSLLARSATGQRLSSYTNVITGTRRPDEVDGPEELHVVVLDNGRSRMLGGEHHEMLSCIRCGACLNVCPVYRQVGGHAYGSVHPGPMGSVLTPLLNGDGREDGGDDRALELAEASTLCGACMDACPVQIPLQDMLLSLRRERAGRARSIERAAWRLWAAAWADARRYGATTRAATWTRVVDGLAGKLPVAATWQQGRTLPLPARERFRDRWRKGRV